MATDKRYVEIARRGLMLVISSPSGAGKSTIARNVLEADRGMSLSVSVTTRARRRVALTATRCATVVSHAAGLCGRPFAGQSTSARA